MKQRYSGLCIFLLSFFYIAYSPQAFSQGKVVVAAQNASPQEKKSAQFICDGNNDQEEIMQAMKSGKVVELSSGDFYCLETIIGQNNILQGKGKQKTKIHFTNVEQGVVLGGKRSLMSLGKIKLSKGGKTINSSKNLAQWINPGDRVLITSSDDYNGLRSYYKKGESVIISSVSGNSCTIKGGLKDDYNKKVSLTYYELADHVGIQNLSVEMKNGSVCLYIKNATNAFYKNVALKDVTEKAKQGFRISHVYGFTYENLEAEGILQGHEKKLPHGYGFYISGAENGEISNCHGKNNKHSFEISGYGASPVTRNIIVKNCSSTNDWKAGFSTHGAASGIQWLNCTVKNGNGGFLLRSDHNQIINPVIDLRPDALNAAFFFGEYTQQGGVWDKFDGIGGNNLQIKNAQVNCNNSQTPYFTFRDPIRHFHLEGGEFKGSPVSILSTEGNICHDFLIKNVTFHASRMRTLFNIYPGDGDDVVQLTFENVTICGAGKDIQLVNTENDIELDVKNINMDCKQ